VILLSSVIQYIEKPYELLDTIISCGFEWIIFDKTPFVNGNTRDRITIQKVLPTIYSASYPCWFFDKDRFLSYLLLKYDVVEEFECNDYSNIKSKFLGFLLKKRC
jgi:putative methyltransferase (TIGR04325 family)